MSISQFPQRGYVQLKLNDQYLNLDLQVTSENCPNNVREFLIQCGWIESLQEPNTYEPLFTKEQEMGTQCMRFRWHEAMAYEFYKFISLSVASDT